MFIRAFVVWLGACFALTGSATVHAQSLDGGRFHTLQIGANGVVSTWGSNVSGQLGTNTGNRPTPETIGSPATTPRVRGSA